MAVSAAPVSAQMSKFDKAAAPFIVTLKIRNPVQLELAQVAPDGAPKLSSASWIRTTYEAAAFRPESK